MNTKTIKTSEATGPALDWLVARCEGESVRIENRKVLPAYSQFMRESVAYSSDWSIAGPIIGREGITLVRADDEYGTDKQGYTTSKRIPLWAATTGQHSVESDYGSHGDYWGQYYKITDAAVCGPSPLIAAMRCYVASKMGDTVEVPEELTR